MQDGASTPEQTAAGDTAPPRSRRLTSVAVTLAVVSALSVAALGLRWRSAVTLDSTGPDTQILVAVVLGLLVLLVAAGIPIAVLAARYGERVPRRRSTRRDALLSIVFLILALYLASQLDRDDRQHSTPGSDANPDDARQRVDAGGVDWSWLSGLAVAALILAVALIVAVSSARARAAAATAATESHGRQLTEQSLAAAVQAARRNLDLGDNDRAAVIASYTAMQCALAEQGAPLAASDTATDLLDRVTRLGLVAGPAAGQLAELYRQARFSPSALPPDAADVARRSLAAMQAELSAAGQHR